MERRQNTHAHEQQRQRQRQPPVNTHKLYNVQQMQCALCARFAIIISCARTKLK